MKIEMIAIVLTVLAATVPALAMNHVMSSQHVVVEVCKDAECALTA